MASRRLTKAVKEDILNSVINRTLGDRKTALRLKEEQLAELVYQVIYTADDRALMMSLPQGWLGEVHTMNIKFDLSVLGDPKLVQDVKSDKFERGTINIKPYYGSELRMRFTSCRRVPMKDHHRTQELNEEQARKIAGPAAEVLRESIAIEISRRDLSNKIEALLAQCSTDKKLLEFWPEAAQYLPEELKQSPSYLPAVTAKELNDLIAVLKPVSGDAPAV